MSASRTGCMLIVGAKIARPNHHSKSDSLAGYHEDMSPPLKSMGDAYKRNVTECWPWGAMQENSNWEPDRASGVIYSVSTGWMKLQTWESRPEEGQRV